MAREAITRTAPGWEERTVTLLPSGARMMDGESEAVQVRPGFARVALLLDVTVAAPGIGLRVWVQHSPDGARWTDLAAFEHVTAPNGQVAWIEAQPSLAGGVFPRTNGTMSEGEIHSSGFVMSRLRVRWTCGGGTHTFGVEAVAIYERR